MSAALKRAALAAFSLLSMLAGPGASAYPERPVRLIIPSTPGSGPDGVGRILAARLSTLLGQQIVIDNRAGANGIVASEIAARAIADGYTLLVTSGSHTINPHVYRKLPYDTLEDFTPITRFVATNGLVVVVNPGFSARTAQQLIEAARGAPGKIAYASAGVGNLTHLAAALFCIMAKVDMTHVPYKGGGPAITDLISGQVQIMFASGPASIPHVKSTRLRAIGVTGLKRMRELAEVPTLDESALKGYEATSWYGLYGPARLPPALVRSLYEHTRDAVHHPETRSAYARFDIEPVDTAPQAFVRFLREDLAKYAKVVQAAGVEKQ